jgi:flagellar L-ring protein precursor FlgH
MKNAVLALVMSLAAGCMYPPVQMKQDTFNDQPQAPRASYANGSIWQESSSSHAEDFKARRRGDIVTVVIAEQASASKEATTGTKRATGISAAIPNFMGIETTALANYLNLNNLVNATTSSKYDGSGSTTRKDVLSATVSARVVDVLPNGNLRIEGQRSVRVNNEDQVMMLEGTVRPRDISQDNMISSAMIADARITYSGNGIITDRQQPGWLMNLVDKVWPF